MRLSPRESAFIGFGLILLIVLGVYFLLLEPLAERRDRLERLTARLEGDLTEMQALAARYQAMTAAQNRLRGQVQARGRTFAPFSYLENLAQEAGLSGQIESMTPVPSGPAEEGRPALTEVDVRLTGIKLLELIRFLYRIEASDKVFFIINLNIRPRYLSPDLLDVNLRLATPTA